MTTIGNHMKFTAAKADRARVRAFYGALLGGRLLPAPSDQVDLFVFPGEHYIGVAFVDAAEALPAAQALQAAWLEIKTAQPDALKAKLLAFGVTPIDYADKSRFYFQAPGGQVFRLAPSDGGV